MVDNVRLISVKLKGKKRLLAICFRNFTGFRVYLLSREYFEQR